MTQSLTWNVLYNMGGRRGHYTGQHQSGFQKLTDSTGIKINSTSQWWISPHLETSLFISLQFIIRDHILACGSFPMDTRCECIHTDLHHQSPFWNSNSIHRQQHTILPAYRWWFHVLGPIFITDYKWSRPLKLPFKHCTQFIGKVPGVVFDWHHKLPDHKSWVLSCCLCNPRFARSMVHLLSNLISILNVH